MSRQRCTKDHFDNCKLKWYKIGRPELLFKSHKICSLMMFCKKNRAERFFLHYQPKVDNTIKMW